MTVIIVHSETCTRCEEAIRYYRGRGIEPQLCEDLQSLGPLLAMEMRTDVALKGGDVNKLPLVFEDYQYVEWKGTA
ncbi:MAG: hypothetical protein LUC93_00680 [Planctomycetaceae bacterium]|nr:hypothetical protein [Planctomycetaceae bacterium]